MPPSNKAPVILFDLDRTMMDTGALGRAIVGNFDEKYASIGVERGTFERWTSEYVDSIGSRTNFNPVNLTQYWHDELALLTKKELVPSSPTLLAEFNDFILTSVNRFLYSDTLAALQVLTDLGCTLCLFTQGVETWQKLKFAHAQIAHFFADELQFVSADKTSLEFLQQIRAVLAGKQLGDRDVWLIDDTLPVISTAKKHWPELRTILICREGASFASQSDTIDSVITNLSQLVAMVRDARS